MKSAGFSSRRCLAALFAASLLCPSSLYAASPLEALLEDFESGNTAGAVAADATNSSAGGPSNTSVANVSESGSQRLKLTDADGLINGAVITLPGALPAPGYYLLTADVKVDNSSTPIGTYGMAANVGGPSTSKRPDYNAGYILNLTGSGDAALGYQTIGAAVQAADDGGVYPRDVTIYFSTDVSGNPSSVDNFGNYNGNHRPNTATWAAGSNNAVYIDNIKRIGPGNYGEERHLWISVGDNFTNLGNLENILLSAKQHNFNCVDILARYRADAYYIPRRTDTTYPNPEPLGTRIGTAVSATNDPLQYAIDRGHELGLKVYISFSSMLVSTNGTYPSTLPSGSIQWFYNSGAPRAMTTADAGGSEGVWADPSRNDVRAYTKNVLMDIVSNYDIDGVIMDRLRYPGNSYSYNPTGLANIGVSGTPTPTNAAFIEARRECIASYYAEFYDAVMTKKPWIVLGSTPVNTLDNMVDTYNQYFQYWPKWTGRKSTHRAVGFGAVDLMQPQFYRQWSTTSPYQAPASNARLMDKADFGDPSFSADYGLMNGVYAAVAPLLFYQTGTDATQAGAISQNIVDTRSKGMNGWGVFSATNALTNINGIRSTGANTAGVDVLAQASQRNEYLWKADFDNFAPNAVTGFKGVANPDGTVTLTWNAPAPAADGDTAAKYLIYRSTSSTVKEYWANLLTPLGISGNATSFTVPAGATGTYYYKIVPVDDYNNHGPASTKGPISPNGTPALPGDTIVDNPAATLNLGWTVGTSSTDKFGANYLSKGKGTGTGTARFTATIPQDGNYDVWEWHPQGTNRTTAGTHTITRDGGANLTAAVNQQINGGKWNKIATAQFRGGQQYSVTIDDNFLVTAGVTVVMADAIRWSFSSSLAGTSAAPGGLTATGYGSSTINLAWFDNASNETGYQVLRSPVAGGPYTLIASLPANSTSYSDLNLPGGNYYYVVRAVNAAGNSLYSNESMAHVPVPAPAQPVGLSASLADCTTIELGWTPIAEVGEATDQVVERASSASGPFDAIAVISPLAFSYTDANLLSGTTYYYQVRAANGDVVSAASNQASAATPALPALPGSFSATVISQTEISLSWQDNATNEDGYEVVRDGNVIATLPAGSMSYDDTGLSAATAYTYTVRATSACGSSNDAQSESATTLPYPPAAPTNLQASTTGQQVTLTWEDNATNEEQYEVLRDGGVVATLAADSTSWSGEIEQCTTFAFTVRAMNAGGYSGDSNSVDVVVDLENPTITAPADVVTGNDAGVCGASNVILGAPATADNCGVANVANNAPASLPVGTTSVTWTVTDVHGHTATATQQVTVEDRENPTITAPADVTVNTDAGQAYASGVNLGSASSADNCGVAETTNNAPAQYAIGTTQVTWTTTDVHGHTATAVQNVTVEDHEAPVINCLADINVPASLNLTVPVTYNPTATDNAPGVSVSCSPASGSGFAVGTTEVTVTATDAAGNTSTCKFKVIRQGLTSSAFASPVGGSVESGNGGSFASPLKTFKLGSTVPVKFNLTNSGAPVATGVHTLTAIKYSNATTAAAPIDATPSDAATSGNQFRLTNASTGEWHFNMKTGAGFSAGTWLLVATMADGTQQSVWVALK
jgi:uncharacterized lipoprotein YddW (UPF0748 family)